MEARAIATATYEMNAALQKSCLTTYCALNIRCSRSCFHQLRITLNNKFKWDSPDGIGDATLKSFPRNIPLQQSLSRKRLFCMFRDRYEISPTQLINGCIL